MSRLDTLGIGGPAFPANSRYAGQTIRLWIQPDGAEISYVSRRFVPPPGSYAGYGEHIVTGFDRADLIAANRFGDPLLSWRLADANGAVHPRELTVDVGRALLLPLPAGVSAPSNGIDDLG